MSMPQQKPGKSKQDYQTPPELLEAIRRRLNIKDFALDVAASPENRVCEDCYTEEDNALILPWAIRGWNWCNPPYANIGDWVEKAIYESCQGAYTAMLIPASVGSNWWSHAEKYCYQLFLSPRITFVGCDTPYPKDCALLLFTPMGLTGNQVWRWK